MTREEQIIKEASRQEELVNIDAESFIEGAKWADKNTQFHWISVDDDLPCNHEELIEIKSNIGEHYSHETVFVIALLKSGFISQAFMNGTMGKWKWYNNESVTHWMPIPKIPEELL